MNCARCGQQIFLEDDDLITCGNAFVVWYSNVGNGKRAMTCDGIHAHIPTESRSFQCPHCGLPIDEKLYRKYLNSQIAKLKRPGAKGIIRNPKGANGRPAPSK